MKILDKKNEKGFISGFILLFVVTLALMGVGGAILMESEGKSVGSSMEAIQTDYAAESAMWFAIQATAVDPVDTLNALIDEVPFSIGSVTITNIEPFIDEENNFILVTAQSNKSIRNITSRIATMPGLVAVTSTKAVTNLTVYNQDGNEDPDLIDQNEDQLPVIDTNNLQTIATNQGYVQNGNFTAPDGWPNGSFYNANGSPNVTNITGNFDVGSWDDVFGIYVVNGNVNIAYGAQVHGIIYALNGNNTVQLNGPSGTPSVEGGIITDGTVDGEYWFFGSRNSAVRYEPDFISNFINSGNINVPDRIDVQDYAYH